MLVNPRLDRRLPEREQQGIGRQLGWSFIDQALSGLTNFLVTAILLRYSSPGQFGRLSLILLGYAFAVTMSRALVSTPIMISPEGVSTVPLRLAAGLGGLVAGPLIVSGLLFHWPVLFVMGVGAVPLLVQDSGRYVWFSVGRPAEATLLDAIWTLTQFGLLAALFAVGHRQTSWLLASWIGGAAASAIVAWQRIQRREDGRRDVRYYLSRHRAQIRTLLGEYLVVTVVAQATPYATLLVLNISEVGSLRAALTLLAPATLLLQAFIPQFLREGAVRANLSSRGSVERSLFRLHTALAGLIGLVGVVTWLLPGQLLHDAFGATAVRAQPLVLGAACALAILVLAMASISGMRVLGLPRLAMSSRIGLGLAELAGALVGADLFGTAGAYPGSAAGLLVGGLVITIRFLQMSDSKAHRGSTRSIRRRKQVAPRSAPVSSPAIVTANAAAPEGVHQPEMHSFGAE